MPYRRFMAWNIAGALGWVLSMTLVGVLLGHIPGIGQSIDAIMLMIIAVSILPIVFSATRGYLRNRRSSADEQPRI